jgi:hypothetical protein
MTTELVPKVKRPETPPANEETTFFADKAVERAVFALELAEAAVAWAAEAWA